MKTRLKWDFAVLELSLVNELCTLDLRKIVGEHKVRILMKPYCARVMKNECRELRAGVLVLSLYG